MTDKLLELSRKRDSIVIFRCLAGNETVLNLLKLLDSDTEDVSEYICRYGNFVFSLYTEGTANLSEFLLKTVLESENVYLFNFLKYKKTEIPMQEALFHELQFLQELSQLTPEDFMEEIEYDGFMPRWETSPIDFIGSYQERLKLINHYGYGIWASNKMFILKNDEIQPVEYPDTQKLSELFGYENERKAVIDNTLALLNGNPAHNVLLYGDAGTGKSSTVKAIVNQYYDMGLRLIQISKKQFSSLPDIIDEITDNPLKFIIFIDDLSFSSDDDSYSELKAVLEGSVSARSENAVIYATSNRRHLVKESFSDRDGDDIHRNDTMQEKLSLSARFGLRVNFSRPDKNSYTSIVRQLALLNDIDMNEEKLNLKAEQFAVSSGNGRSPRTAKQFINQLINERKNNND